MGKLAVGPGLKHTRKGKSHVSLHLKPKKKGKPHEGPALKHKKKRKRDVVLHLEPRIFRKMNEELAVGIEALKVASEKQHHTLMTVNENLRLENQELRKSNESLQLSVAAFTQGVEQFQRLIMTNKRVTLANRELRKANEELQAKIAALRAANEQHEASMTTDDSLSLEKRELRANEEWQAEAHLPETENELEKQELSEAKEELLSENETLNERFKEENLNAEQMSSLEKDRSENEEGRIQLDIVKDSKEQNTEHKEDASLGKNMYDSLFSIKVDTPDIHPDPLVWGIVCAAVPPEYAIPDPDFTNELTALGAS